MMSLPQYEEWAREHHHALTPKSDKADQCPKKHKRWSHDNMTRVTICTDCGREFSGSQLVGPLPD